MPNIGDVQPGQNIGLGYGNNYVWNGAAWKPQTGGLDQIYTAKPSQNQYNSNAGQYWQEFNGLGYSWDPGTQSWRVRSSSGGGSPAATPPTPTTPATDPYTGQRSNYTQAQNDVRTQTDRNLGLLQSTLGQQQRGGINALRQNLAQRGLMDSGSLGQGITNINQSYGNQMAQGTQMAANQESQSLLSLLEQAQNQAYGQDMFSQQAALQRQLANMGYANQQQLMSEQGQQGLLQSLIGGGSNIVSGLLPLIFGSGQGSGGG